MNDRPIPSLDELAAAYALGALSPEETRAFEAHLAESPEMQREVADYREVGALLALNAEAPPPDAALRQRVLDRIARERDRPLPAQGAGPRRAPPAMWGALAASLALAVGLGAWALVLRGQLGEQQALVADREARLAAREATLNAILEPDVVLYRLSASGESPPVIQLFWDRRREVAIVHAFNLPPAPAGRAYQLWLIPEGGAPVPSRVFNTEPTGHGLVEGVAIPTLGEGRYGAFAVTEEPELGSAQPTSPVLLLATTS